MGCYITYITFLLIFIIIEIFVLIKVYKENQLLNIVAKGLAVHKNQKENIVALFNWITTNQRKKNKESSISEYIYSYLSGECGRNAKLFALLVRKTGTPARLAYLYRDEEPIHVIAEVYYEEKWRVFDVGAGYYYLVNGNSFATAEDLKNSPSLFESVVNKYKYNPLYTYEDVRRTNWIKVPIVLPALYRVLKKIIGNKVDEFDLNIAFKRSTLLSKVLFLCIIALLTGLLFSNKGNTSHTRETAMVFSIIVAVSVSIGLAIILYYIE